MVEYLAKQTLIDNLDIVNALGGHYGISLTAINRLPAADVRPVVLCRDCEHYQADCGWCGLLDIGMNINGFCSRGVKREES